MKQVITVILASTCIMMTNISAASSDGKAIYDGNCSTCHAAGIAGAPKFGDKEAWKARISTGMDSLFASVKNGKTAMPPKGTCMDCSDESLKAAINYMVKAL